MKLHATALLALTGSLIACSADVSPTGAESSAVTQAASVAPASCGGSIAATTSAASASCNASTAPFSAPFDPGGGMVSTDLASGRQIVITLGSSATTVGETYSLTGENASSDQAIVTYNEAPIPGTSFDNSPPLFGNVWTSTGGTVTVTAVSSCFVSFAFNASLSAGAYGTGGGAAGTFTLSGTVTHALQACGTVSAKFASVTGNANASALKITNPEVSNTGSFVVEGAFFPVPNLNEPREITIQVGAPVAPGQTYALSNASPTATTASVFYLQSDNSVYGIDQCWLASSGTLAVTSTDSCELSFTITGAKMSPVPEGNIFCDGLNDARGSFTLSVTGTGEGLSQ